MALMIMVGVLLHLSMCALMALGFSLLGYRLADHDGCDWHGCLYGSLDGVSPCSAFRWSCCFSE